MKHPVLRVLTSACLLGAPGLAGAEAVSFEDRVRAFLLANPEVIMEALEVLAEREAKEAVRARIAGFPQLFTDPPQLGVGARDARVRVVEFFDYKCVPCKAVHPDLVALARAQPDLRIEMRHLPILTPGSERAARFALATQAAYGAEEHAQVDARLWQVVGPLNDAAFETIAADLGLDYALIAPLMQSDAVTEQIDYNRDAAIALEIRGTPAFVTPDGVTVGSTDLAGMAEVWLSR